MISEPLASAATSGTGWVHTALSRNTKELHFYLDYDCYVACTGLSGDPAQNGAKYTAGVTHRIPCMGALYVHHKRVGGSDATLYPTCLTGSQR